MDILWSLFDEAVAPPAPRVAAHPIDPALVSMHDVRPARVPFAAVVHRRQVAAADAVARLAKALLTFPRYCAGIADHRHWTDHP